jgi:putative methyltransferase (TIGR04325 family)
VSGPSITSVVRRTAARLPLVRAIANPGITFTGDYPSFEAALEAAHTAADDNYQQLSARSFAIERARRGRDELTPIPGLALGLLAALQHITLQGEERLDIVDFGGGMGHHYFELRPHLDCPVTWHVVELPRTAEQAHELFGSEELRFHVELTAVPVSPNVVVAAGALQYTSDPFRYLQLLAGLGSHWLLLDRLPLIDGPRDRLTVQTVPPTLYDARYPAWFLSRERLDAELTGWSRRLHWQAVERIGPGSIVEYSGLLLERDSEHLHAHERRTSSKPSRNSSTRPT